MTQEVFKNLEERIKINVDPILCGPSAKIHFSVEFQVVPNKLRFIS
jgi:hypothetical protein